ncbi:MAG: YeeE/YedE thiosulfate transporter family protein [Candidatus Electryoneaceae bacterium]|nr:YeeE/YedE thiosulfate transporter family protein [Candidatus Electryoneaceae bacterium]
MRLPHIDKSTYMNPYFAGFLLGLLLLVTIFITGRGLGASGAFKSLVVTTVEFVAPSHAESTPFFSNYIKTHSEGGLKSWLFFEVFGVLVGGFLSGLISGRLGIKNEHGPGISGRIRLIAAFGGGILFGIGSQLGRGCTSGAALSGMAVMSSAGFITMMAIFGSGYAFAYFFRKLWV